MKAIFTSFNIQDNPEWIKACSQSIVLTRGGRLQDNLMIDFYNKTLSWGSALTEYVAHKKNLSSVFHDLELKKWAVQGDYWLRMDYLHKSKRTRTLDNMLDVIADINNPKMKLPTISEIHKQGITIMGKGGDNGNSYSSCRAIVFEGVPYSSGAFRIAATAWDENENGKKVNTQIFSVWVKFNDFYPERMSDLEDVICAIGLGKFKKTKGFIPKDTTNELIKDVYEQPLGFKINYGYSPTLQTKLTDFPFVMLYKKDSDGKFYRTEYRMVYEQCDNTLRVENTIFDMDTQLSHCGNFKFSYMNTFTVV